MANNSRRRRKTPWRATLAVLAALATVLPALGAHGAVLQGSCVTVYPSGPGAHVDPECRPVGMSIFMYEHVHPTSPYVSDLWNQRAKATYSALAGIPILSDQSALGANLSDTAVGSPMPDPGALDGEPDTVARSSVATLVDAELPDDRGERLEVN